MFDLENAVYFWHFDTYTGRPLRSKLVRFFDHLLFTKIRYMQWVDAHNGKEK